MLTSFYMRNGMERMWYGSFTLSRPLNKGERYELTVDCPDGVYNAYATGKDDPRHIFILRDTLNGKVHQSFIPISCIDYIIVEE